MKIKSILVGAVVTSMTFGISSCSKKGCTDSLANNYDEKARKDDGSCQYDIINEVLSGEVSSDKTLSYLDVNGNVAEYTLAGGVHIKDGATLTIEPGVVIKSDPEEAVAYLLVEQGGKLNATGTEDKPIVFTSGATSPARGDWGGIIICGKAPINKGTTATAEVGDVLYGGTASDDNSGTLKYVRVEYTGNAINSEKEHNGFTFNGVGSGTTLQYLQAYMGGDDGFEFFGGTVNASYLISSGSKDDSFDWTFGWTGSGSYWIAEQASDEGDRGIEADNQSGANTATPYSNPTLSNITLMGRGAAAGKDAMKLREGTKGNFSNILIDGFKDAIDIQHEQTVTNSVNNDIVFTDVKISNTTNEVVISDFSAASDSTSAYDKIIQKIGNTATGAGSDWTNNWTKSL